ncbi:MAG: YHS domain-containing protein [Gammaproteobacteria bacterium]
MEGLLSLLLFAVLFFVMMRFGCGAHMKHGHGQNHKESHDHTGHDTEHDVAPQKHIDPVCGIEVDVEQGYGKMHEGTLYRFCSRDCLDKFEADPEQYAKKNITHENHHEGGAL